MIHKQKQQLSAGSTLREDPTIDSALPSGSPARTAQWESRIFSVGDLIVEDIGYGAPRLGIIIKTHNENRTLSVHFSDGVQRTVFVGYCQPYEEWLQRANK